MADVRGRAANAHLGRHGQLHPHRRAFDGDDAPRTIGAAEEGSDALQTPHARVSGAPAASVSIIGINKGALRGLAVQVLPRSFDAAFSRYRGRGDARGVHRCA